MLNFGRNGKLFRKWRNLYVQRIRSVIASRRNNDGNGRVFGGSGDSGVHNDGIADRAAATTNGGLGYVAHPILQRISTNRHLSGHHGRDSKYNSKRLSIALDTTHRDLYERYKAGDESALEEARQMVREAAAKAMPYTKVVDMDSVSTMP
jgi:hypothetical protein